MQINNFLNIFTELAPTMMRPKCLVIYICEKSVNCVLSFESILQYAWSLYFLDLSVIEISPKSNFDKSFGATIHYYNPFLGTFSRKIFSNNDHIFVDKLKNLNGYPLKLPMLYKPPLIEITEDNLGNMMDAKGIFYELIKIATNKLKQTIVFINVNKENVTFPTKFQQSFVKMQNQEINIVPVPLWYHNFRIFSDIEINYGHDRMVALVPILSYKKVTMPLSIITYVMILLFVICLILLLKFLKVISENWEMFKVIQLLFGIPTLFATQNLRDKSILLSVLCLSVYFSFHFYSTMLEISLKNFEEPFETFEDIIKSPFKIVSQPYIDSTISGIDKEDLKKIRQKTISKEAPTSTDECIAQLLKSKNVICLGMALYVEPVVNDNLDINGQPVVKIAKPMFASSKLTFKCEMGFPLINEYQKIFQRVYESGILLTIRRIISCVKRLPRKEINSGKADVPITIMGPYCIGNILAIIIFIIEITSSQFKKNFHFFHRKHKISFLKRK